MCIRVRLTGIRVRITTRGRITEIVLGCSGHYIDPNFVRIDVLIRVWITYHVWIRVRITGIRVGNTRFLKSLVFVYGLHTI